MVDEARRSLVDDLAMRPWQTQQTSNVRNKRERKEKGKVARKMMTRSPPPLFWRHKGVSSWWNSPILVIDTLDLTPKTQDKREKDRLLLIVFISTRDVGILCTLATRQTRILYTSTMGG